MATPEIFLVAKTLISALARVNEVNAGVTTPETCAGGYFYALFAYLHWLKSHPSQA